MRITAKLPLHLLEGLLDSVGKSVLVHSTRTAEHLGRSKEHLTALPVRAEDAVVQIRNALQQVLEDLSTQAAAFRKESIPCKQPKPSFGVRVDYLIKVGLLQETEKQLFMGAYQWLSDRSAHPGFLPDVENFYKITNGLLCLGRLHEVAERTAAALAHLSTGNDLAEVLHLLQRGIVDPVLLRNGDPFPFARCPRCEADGLQRGDRQVGPDDYARYVKCNCGWEMEDLGANGPW